MDNSTRYPTLARTRSAARLVITQKSLRMLLIPLLALATANLIMTACPSSLNNKPTKPDARPPTRPSGGSLESCRSLRPMSWTRCYWVSKTCWLAPSLRLTSTNTVSSLATSTSSNANGTTHSQHRVATTHLNQDTSPLLLTVLHACLVRFGCRRRRQLLSRRPCFR